MKKVAVVGAGLAGLRAAKLLEEAGCFVQVFEAESAPGGRLSQDAFPGAESNPFSGRFRQGWSRVAGLVDSLGLAKVEASAREELLICDGETALQSQLWKDAAGDLAALEEAASDLLEDLAPAPWDSLELAELDAQALSDFLDFHCGSPRGRWLAESLERTAFREDSDELGLLGWLTLWRGRQKSNLGGSYKAAGGPPALVLALVESLRSPIHLDRRLESVAVKEDCVQLWFNGEVAFCDEALLSLSPSSLLEIDFAEDIPAERLAAWELMGASRMVRFTAEFQEPWWEQLGAHGVLRSDSLWQTAWSPQGSTLHGEIVGAAAEDLMNSDDPEQELLRSFEQTEVKARISPISCRIFPSAANNGAPYLGQGGVMGALPHLRDPIGRLHFAGAYTSIENLGTLEGALESAERAAQQLLDRK